MARGGESPPPPQEQGFSGGGARQTGFDATIAVPHGMGGGREQPQPANVPHPPPPIVGEWGRTPVIRPKTEPAAGSVEPSIPKKRAPWLVLFAVLLTVALVVVAIVANELGH